MNQSSIGNVWQFGILDRAACRRLGSAMRVAGPGALLLATLGVPILPETLPAQDSDLSFERLSVEHGLSHGSVYSIIQDATGFMWFATEDGLNRYDGIRITVHRHRPSDVNSLSSSHFGKVLEDRSGILWLGTWGGGLDRLDPAANVYTHYRNDAGDPSSLSGDRIELLHEDSQGLLWIGAERAGLNRLDRQRGRFIRYRHDAGDPYSLGSDEVKAIAEDRHGALWVGTNKGLSRLDRESDRFFHHRHDAADSGSLSDNRVRAILESGSGELWVGTRGGGLNRLDPATGRFQRFKHRPGDPYSLSDDSVACLLQDSHGTLWIGTYNGGLDRYEPAGERFIAYRRDPRSPGSLGSNRVETLYEDRAEILWIGTRGGGVYKHDLKPAKFSSYRHDPSAGSGNGLPHHSVRAIAAAGDGELWIGTDGGGLARLDHRRGRFERYRQDPGADGSSSDRIWSLLVDRAGALWIGRYRGGLDRLTRDRAGYRLQSFAHDPRDPASLSNDNVQTLFEDRSGALWVGTMGGLNRVTADPDRAGLTFVSYRHAAGDPKSLSDDTVNAVYEDRSGDLWVGTSRGLNRSDRDGGFRRFRHDASNPRSLSGDVVQVVFGDSLREGVLWVGTEDGGLSRLDVAGETFKRYLVDHGLPSNVVNGILEDAAGDLWLATSRGLSRFDPESERFRNFDLSDGLAGYGFVRNSAFDSRAGEMFFGGIAGITYFFPDQVRDNPHPPPVVLTSVRVYAEGALVSELSPGTSEIHLDHGANFMSIEFAALDYSSPADNHYAYRLEGLDPDWFHIGNRSSASYANLAPGEYVFRVKGANSDGVWNEPGRTVRVIVPPPFWQETWFLGVSLLVLGALALAAYRTGARVIAARAVETQNVKLSMINKDLQKQIAERRRVESEKERLISELEAKNAEMERFTYTVSHDLKSPLITIKGFLGMWQQDAAAGDAERMARDVSRIGSAADKMNRLLDELLELSRIGRVVNPPAEVPFAELVGEALELSAGRLAERGVDVDVAPDLPVVYGDRIRLAEVLQNLIDNAVKFMHDQPAPRLEIGCRADGGERIFHIRDNGCGIEPAYLERVFELFERLEPEIDGTGIGLALVRRIVELHGGRVWVESEGRGRGTTVCFTLPGSPAEGDPGIGAS